MLYYNFWEILVQPFLLQAYHKQPFFIGEILAKKEIRNFKKIILEFFNCQK
jgi:hypothetical protein